MNEESPLKQPFRYRPWLMLIIAILFGSGAAMAFAPMLTEIVVDYFYPSLDE